MKRIHLMFVALTVLIIGLLAGCAGSATQSGSNVSATTDRSNTQTSISTDTKNTVPENRLTGSTEPQNAVKPQAPVAAEKNPPGDIPDNQVFLSYKSTSGRYQVKVPEGWARSTSKSAVSFTDKLNKIKIDLKPGTAAPTVGSARSTEVAALSKAELAFQLQSIQQVALPGGGAILITYRVNSEPNQVTGKQYRLDVLRYEFFKNGMQADMVLSSPVGADNVDPWNIVSRSFAWQH